MTNKPFDPRSLSTLKSQMAETFDYVRRVNTHNGFTFALSLALDIMREHGMEVDHPIRRKTFKLLMDVNEDNVRAIIDQKAKITEDRLERIKIEGGAT